MSNANLTTSVLATLKKLIGKPRHFDSNSLITLTVINYPHIRSYKLTDIYQPFLLH